MAPNSAPLSRLPNLGPKSAAMLESVGITTPAQLESMGATRAYLLLERNGVTGLSLNMLYALEGALTGQPWQRMARLEKTRLLTQLEAAREQFKLEDT